MITSDCTYPILQKIRVKEMESERESNPARSFSSCLCLGNDCFADSWQRRFFAL
jgi:hypothetical protein